MLKDKFSDLISPYSPEWESLWDEIANNYQSKGRHYHTLQHLENLLKELTAVKDDINNWEAVLFALFYHDIVYLASRSDNEQRSADLAEDRMWQLGVSETTVLQTTQIILLTKSHEATNNPDAKYFLDADLSILGKDWSDYETYFHQIRKEFSIYPSLIYNPGRRKVLKHFLAMPHIYKTGFFREKYEAKARENMKKELTML